METNEQEGGGEPRKKKAAKVKAKGNGGRVYKRRSKSQRIALAAAKIEKIAARLDAAKQSLIKLIG